MRITLILSLLLAILAVVFALQNPEPMQVMLGPFNIQGSTALILIATLCIGVVVGILAAVPSLMKRRKRVRELERGTADATVGARSSSETDWTKPQSDIAARSSQEPSNPKH